MQRHDIDMLYHELRKVSTLMAEDGDGRRAIRGIAQHLTGNNYEGLIEFLSWYGVTYLGPKIKKVCRDIEFALATKPERVVEIGAGAGWFGRLIANEFGVSYIPTDSRLWPGIINRIDVETAEGRKALSEMLRPGDLVAACDMLHCIDNPDIVLGELCCHPLIIAETIYLNDGYRMSYIAQLSRLGATPMTSSEQLLEIFRKAQRSWWQIRPSDTTYSMFVLP